ncbi:hypothetical protein [Salmonella phage SSBI34]|nr:hypothetical protein [Salmonella phage SSBI34]
MKLKCVNVISDFKSVFPKGETFEATELKNGFCDVEGTRKKRNGTDWTGVLSLGHVVVLGVAKFEILSETEEKNV